MDTLCRSQRCPSWGELTYKGFRRVRGPTTTQATWKLAFCTSSRSSLIIVHRRCVAECCRVTFKNRYPMCGIKLITFTAGASACFNWKAKGSKAGRKWKRKNRHFSYFFFYFFEATTFKVEENSRTFKGKMEFKDFSRTSPKIQGLFKTVRALVKCCQRENGPFSSTPNKSHTYFKIGN